MVFVLSANKLPFPLEVGLDVRSTTGWTNSIKLGYSTSSAKSKVCRILQTLLKRNYTEAWYFVVLPVLQVST
jgi:hypothetical protein